jgi:hypothetical protein
VSGLGTDTEYDLLVLFLEACVLKIDVFRAMRRDAKTVADWDFDKIIPCHGVSSFILLSRLLLQLFQDVVEKDAKQAWRNLYKSYLD